LLSAETRCCYYQISRPGSTNFSRCYPLTGVKTSPATNARAQEGIGVRLPADEERALEHESPNTEGVATPVAPEIIEKYLQMRSK